MLLYIVRHGIAISHDDPQCPPEPERHLTPEGVERTREAAKGLATLGVKPDIIISSPYIRAYQTAEIMAEAVGYSGNIAQTGSLLPGAPPREFLDELAGISANEVMCCGHAPHLDGLVAACLGSPAVTSLKKAGVAVIELDAPSPNEGMLLALYPPKTLRALA